MYTQGSNNGAPSVKSVGVVGLGTMGGPLARRLLESGFDVHGTNRTAARAETLRAHGLRWHASPREVAAAVDVVISMVTDDRALAEITSGPDGILAGLTEGRVHVDMSSVSPQASVKVAEQAAQTGARMLDAPVSGSVPQVEQGALTILVGGDEQTFEKVEGLLRHLGQSVTRVGENGSGVLLKLAINVSLAVQALAFSEGLLLAERGGLDPRLAAQVMAGSAVGSPMLQARAPLFLDLPETAWFPMTLMHKDLRLALEAGHRNGIVLPTAATAGSVLAEAEQLGYAGRDIAGLYEALATISDQE